MKKDFFNTKLTLTFIIIVLTILSRLLFSPWDKGGFAFDDGNFALAVQSYSVEDSRPHLPGYFLHVKIISLVSFFTGNAFSAMSLISALYSGIAMGLLFLLVINWFSKREALSIILFTATNPLVWFYGCNTEIYPFDLFFGIALVYLGLSSRWIYIIPSFIAFGAGVRPSSFVLLFPLYVFLWIVYHRKAAINWKKFILAHAVGVCFFIAWLFPMLRSIGGVSRFFALYRTHNPMDVMTLAQSIHRLVSYNASLVVAVFLVIIFKLFVPGREEKSSQTGNKDFIKEINTFTQVLLVWIIPPLLIFACYVYSKGYMLLISGGISCLLFIFIRKHFFRNILFITVAVLQTIYFIAAPYSLPDVDSYVALRQRKHGLLQTWVIRMRSKYLLAQSQFRHLKKVDKLIAIISNDIVNNPENVFYTKKYLLIDPTCPLVPRTLQVKHPHIRFAALDLHHEDCFFSYMGLDYENETGIRRLMQSSLIFGRTDFIRHYRLEPLVDKIEYGEWSLYSYKDEAFLKENIPHEVLFSRW